MHLRLIPVTPRLVERLKAAQIAMFGDPSHGGRLHEEVVQTARGPEHRWVAGEAAPKPKKAGPPKTPEKGKDPNDKRTFELDDLINVHKKAQAIPRHHVYQAALQAWNHDPEARERYKEAMVEDTSAGEGPAHQRLRLWYAKGRLRETMKGLDEATFLEAVEALKALAPEIGPPPARNRQTHPFVGTIRIPGLPKIRVETKKGQTRSGVDPDGNAWSVVMPAHYGEFHGTRGVDGDPVDVFVGPDIHAPFAYVFHMSRLGEGGYDEDKVACGFKTREDAERCLRDAYDRAGLFHAPPKRLTIAELAHWLADPDNKGRMVDAGREMAKAVPVPVLSLTGGPVRVARVQVATETPAAGQGLAEAIREGEDIGDGGQDADAPTQAPEVCKDANCTDPAHGHEPEAAKGGIPMSGRPGLHLDPMSHRWQRIVSGVGEDLVKLYHGTSADAARAIRSEGRINAGTYFGGITGVALTPRREMASEYAGEDGEVITVHIPRKRLVVDPESNDDGDIDAAIENGASVYAEGDVHLREPTAESAKSLPAHLKID